MKKYSSTMPAYAHPCPLARRIHSTSALVKTALAGVLAFGLHGALRAATDGDADGGGDAKDKKAVVEKKAEPRVKFSVFVEGGVTGNPNDPDDHQNFGRVFDDRSNEPMLNQATATVERVLVPEPGKFDCGFKVQGGYGSDGRFINTLGTLENVTRNILQPYLVEAYLNLHAPVADGWRPRPQVRPVRHHHRRRNHRSAYELLLFARLHLQLRHPAPAPRRTGHVPRDAPSSTSTRA